MRDRDIVWVVDQLEFRFTSSNTELTWSVYIRKEARRWGLWLDYYLRFRWRFWLYYGRSARMTP